MNKLGSTTAASRKSVRPPSDKRSFTADKIPRDKAAGAKTRKMRNEFEYPLEKHSQITVPDRCVVCDAASPSSEVKIKQGWLDRRMPSDNLLERYAITFKCCPGCRSKALVSRALSGLVFVLSVAIGLFLLWLSTQLFPGALESEWKGILTILVCIGAGTVIGQAIYSPIAILEQSRPRLVVTLGSTEYAKAFAEVNKAVLEE